MNQLVRPLSDLLEAPIGDWQPLVDGWRRSAAGRALIQAVDERVAAGAVVYPAQVFRALELTPLAETKVVILGQDPYHGAGQAEGLAFSVPPGQRAPPSLRNIFKELQRDLGLPVPTSGSLAPWARQGVLLLNPTLTVEDGRPSVHAKLGWQVLTHAICEALAADLRPKVFLLWGAQAQALGLRLSSAATARHLTLACNHPSPLSAARPPEPFIGCGHFGLANRYLSATSQGAVDWALP